MAITVQVVAPCDGDSPRSGRALPAAMRLETASDSVDTCL